jgi:hypothetical protein
MKRLESQLQIACVKWLRMQHPHLSPFLFAIPNGGARSAITGAILKAEGVRRGVADLFLMVPTDNYHGLFIEMKVAKGKQSPEQLAFEADCAIMRYSYALCRTFDEFRNAIETHIGGQR